MQTWHFEKYFADYVEFGRKAFYQFESTISQSYSVDSIISNDCDTIGGNEDVTYLNNLFVSFLMHG